jgi:hypothetical protein
MWFDDEPHQPVRFHAPIRGGVPWDRESRPDPDDGPTHPGWHGPGPMTAREIRAEIDRHYREKDREIRRLS